MTATGKPFSMATIAGWSTKSCAPDGEAAARVRAEGGWLDLTTSSADYEELQSSLRK